MTAHSQSCKVIGWLKPCPVSTLATIVAEFGAVFGDSQGLRRTHAGSSATAEKQRVSYTCISKLANWSCNSLNTAGVVRLAEVVFISSSCRFPIVHDYVSFKKLWDLVVSGQSYCNNNKAYIFGPLCIIYASCTVWLVGWFGLVDTNLVKTCSYWSIDLLLFCTDIKDCLIMNSKNHKRQNDMEASCIELIQPEGWLTRQE